MKHPGINRAIPGAILGFVIGELIVLGLRTLQGLPPWDPGVALVLAPFTLMAGWMWGMGAFNPKMSEHGDHGHDDHAHETTALATVEGEETAIVAHDADVHHDDHEEESTLTEIFFNEIWRATSLPLILLLLIFGFASIPGGFYLRVVDEAAADPIAFDNAITVNAPFFGTIETTQMALFLVFVGWTIVSLLLVASVLALLVWKGDEQVRIAKEMEPTVQQRTPPGFVQAIGRGAKNTARGMRKNLPKTLGN
ncbi:MAG: hypothetical protein AAFV98_04915 [Chloroflexota bacterium]